MALCEHCNGPINKSRWRGRYCSLKCFGESRWMISKARIEAAGCVVQCSPVPAKRYLVETRGDRCELCGVNEWLGVKLPLILDHINGNSDNWLLDNLRLLCSNCDSIQPTYKKRNVGKGRHSRRQRYAEGKSY